MKTIFILSLFFMQLFSASLEHVTINNNDFSLVKEHYADYDSKGEVLKLYKEEQNSNLTFLLSFVLSDSTGGCSSKSMVNGSYEISGDTITFYTMWTRRGKANLSPHGARIQHYKILDSGKLELIEGKVYIEETKKKYDNESGMEYLFHAPKTQKEKEQLQSYVKAVEKKYKATFVFNEEEKSVINEVKEALKQKRKALWSR